METRLGKASEAWVRQRINAGKATTLEEALYAEIKTLRAAIDQYSKRLTVAYPEQAQDFYEEAHKIIHP